MTYAGGNSASLEGLGGSAPKHGLLSHIHTPKIVSNLLDDIEQTAVGIPTGLAYISKNVGKDLWNVATGAHHSFVSDDMVHDMVTTTWKDLDHRWSPLVKGHFGEFLHQVNDHPLSFALDMATVLTGGGAAAAKAGKIAAEAGDVTRLTRAAGLTKSAVHIGEHAPVKALREAGHSAEDAELIGRHQVKAMHGVVDKHGMIWDAPQGVLKVGEHEERIPLSTNPVVRARQASVIRVGNRYASAPFIGGVVRGSRLIHNRIRHTQSRILHQVTSHATRVLNGLGDEDKRVLELANMHAQGISQKDAIHHYETQLKRAEHDEESGVAKRDRADQETMKSKDAVVASKPDAIRMRLELVKSPAWDAAHPDHWSPGVHEAMKALHDVSKEHTRMLWKAAGGKTRGGKEIGFDDFWNLQRSREARHIEDPTNDLLDNYDADTFSAHDLTHEHAYVRPHTSLYDESARGRKGVRRVGGRVVEETNNRAKRNKFLTFDDAMDSLRPENVVVAAQHTIRFQSGIEKYHAIIDAARTLDVGDKIPHGWDIIKADKHLGNIENLSSWVREDARTVYGESKELEALQSTLDDLSKKVDSGRLAAPTHLVKELLTEIQSGNKFIQKYDKATGYWRTFTLTARPTWVVSNIVSNFALLMASQGPIKAASSLMMAIRQGSKDAAILDRHAPEVRGAGLLASSAPVVRGMRKTGGKKSIVSLAAEKASGGLKGMGDKLLQVNQVASEDYVRRAHFLGEIRPHVKEIMDKTGMSFQDAADAFLSDDAVLDTLAKKTLGDLVDFGNLSRVEKQYIRRMVPFYSWVRGATARTWQLLADEPHKALLAAYISGYGRDQLEAEFGKLPDYLYGLIPLGKSGSGQERIINTQPLNPFGTAGDVAGMIHSTIAGRPQVGGSNPASSMNPLLQNALQAVTGTDLFYGGSTDPKGQHLSYGARFLKGLPNMLPQVRLAQKALSDEKPGALYQKSLADLLMGYLVTPEKQLNVAAANEQARRQSNEQSYTLR